MGVWQLCAQVAAERQRELEAETYGRHALRRTSLSLDRAMGWRAGSVLGRLALMMIRMFENGADKTEGAGGAGRGPEEERLERTRTGGIWVSVVVAVIVLVFLLVFIVQNSESVTVHFLWLAGNLPLGVAMIFAVLAGALLVALVGTARILQLRRSAKHRARKQK